MTSPATQPSLSLRSLCTVKLPTFECAPGPLHTILQDEQENIYYSDEINHSVVSLDRSGEVRWHRTKQGKGLGEFNYPKGIELGFIDRGGEQTGCLAVCDSWNSRIQFFSPDGQYLAVWDWAGDVCFSEVVDIRFLRTGYGSNSGSPCWVVLDRGHHTLFGLDPSGQLLFRIGRPFPANLESRWPTPCDSADPQAPPLERFRACLPYDPLFMPSRIFGNTSEALFVLEPKSQRLKQAAAANLLPIWIDLPPGSEWIAADIHGLTAYESKRKLLSRYEWKNGSWRSALMKVGPIVPGRSRDEFWLQNGMILERWNIRAEESEDCYEPETTYKAAAIRVQREIENRLGQKPVLHGIVDLERTVGRLSSIGEQALNFLNSDRDDSELLKKLHSDLTEVQEQFSLALSDMRDLAHLLFLVVLKAQQDCGELSSGEELSEAHMTPIADAEKQFNRVFLKYLNFRDKWFITSTEMQKPFCSMRNLPEEHKILAEKLIALSQSAIVNIAAWAWHMPANRRLASQKRNLGRAQAFRPNPSGFLRELDRIYVGTSGIGHPVRPAALAHFCSNQLVATLQDSSRVIHLDERGQVLGFCGGDVGGICFKQPVGIATDSCGRIWISEPSTNTIKICNLKNDEIQTLDQLTGKAVNLYYPIGMHRTDDGRMLIADTYNNRVLAVTAAGEIDVLLSRVGTNRGELLHPSSFCASNSADNLWVVDHRNHRLQRFALDGTVLQEVGGEGLGWGRLVSPEFSVCYSDGMLVVQERAFIRALKLFSAQGDELETMYLDYAPRGMLIHEGLLLVCGWSGDHIYVYERM